MALAVGTCTSASVRAHERHRQLRVADAKPDLIVRPGTQERCEREKPGPRAKRGQATGDGYHRLLRNTDLHEAMIQRLQIELIEPVRIAEIGIEHPDRGVALRPSRDLASEYGSEPQH